MLASVLGFYSLPGFRNLRPVPHGTPMVKVIGNCIVLLILSSALPVMSRTLGKTAVDGSSEKGPFMLSLHLPRERAIISFRVHFMLSLCIYRGKGLDCFFWLTNSFSFCLNQSMHLLRDHL